MRITEEFNLETEEYFRSQGWLNAKEKVLYYNKAGEGNMNFVARIRTNEGSFIVKQSRPYVEKYPQVPAPVERVLIEKEYYTAAAQSQFLHKLSPKIIGFDEANYVMAMEDLGEASDFLGLYSGKVALNKYEVETLVEYLTTLHELKPSNFPDNGKMKALNHEHIFKYPFLENNGFDLNEVQEGLQELSIPIKRNKLLKAEINILGDSYLANGSCLLHGDFYPGSWLKTENGLKIIDPEFSFMGDAEFDLGVMIAHFKLVGIEEEWIDFAKRTYQKRRSLNSGLLDQYVGVEILRRMVGLAQLPLKLTISQKRKLCMEAEALILGSIS